jgi:hypothetical protein
MGGVADESRGLTVHTARRTDSRSLSRDVHRALVDVVGLPLERAERSGFREPVEKYAHAGLSQHDEAYATLSSDSGRPTLARGTGYMAPGCRGETKSTKLPTGRPTASHGPIGSPPLGPLSGVVVRGLRPAQKALGGVFCVRRRPSRGRLARGLKLIRKPASHSV